MAEPAIVWKTGEGVDKPNADRELPLDVNYTKLIDWLVSRQKMHKDWNKYVTAIQLKANESFKELPASVINKLGGTEAPLDYFRSVQIRDHLAATSERTLFGGLTGQAAVWDKIVKAYEKGGVYLGEAALNMIQNVDYEVPYLRKQAARLNQQMSDAERKQAEYTRNAAQCAAVFKQECKKLGIDGTGDLRKQLQGLSSELPRHLTTLLDALRSDKVAEGMRYYQEFVGYAHGLDASQPLLPILQEVREGRTAPPVASSTSTDSAAAAASAPAPAISWDIGGVDSNNDAGEPAAAAGISWDFDVGPAGDGVVDAGAAAASGGISWDVEVEPQADAGLGGGGGISWDVDVPADASNDAAGGVNWDIGMEDAGASSSAPVEIKWDFDVSSGEAGTGQAAASEGAGGSGASSSDATHAGMDGSGVTGDAAVVLRLEKDAEYRNQLTDDLLELRAYLQQRKADLGSASTQLLSASMPEYLQTVDAAAVSSMLQGVESALGVLQSERVKQLLMLIGSHRFLERMAAGLARKAGQEARLLSGVREVEARRHEAKAQLMALAPKVAELVERTRTIKTKVESAVSVMFSGRKVNVLGEINTILSSTTV